MSSARKAAGDEVPTQNCCQMAGYSYPIGLWKSCRLLGCISSGTTVLFRQRQKLMAILERGSLSTP